MGLTQKRAMELLRKFPRRRVLVVGDLMLDRYVYGAVTRISPEAPVPVVKVSRETSMPGGASEMVNLGQRNGAGPGAKDGVELEQISAHGGIGDVEGGPVPVAHVEVEEIGDVVEAEAVEEVADDAAAEQAEGDAVQAARGQELAAEQDQGHQQ